MQIRPFRAVTYSRKKVRNLSKVVTQPYDKIDDALQATYHGRHKRNFVRVIRGRAATADGEADNVYTRARDTVAKWFADGVLVRDGAPALWAYGVDYTTPEGRTHRRMGVVALAVLEEYGGGIKPHEKTLAGPKADRLNLLRALRGHYEQIFFLYDDQARRADAILAALADTPAALEAKDDDGHVHRCWPIRGTDEIAAIQAAVAAGPTIIADGHHRYETALNYRREMAGVACDGPEAPDAVLGIFVNMAASGLTVLATHRTVKGLPEDRWAGFFERLSPPFEVTALAAAPGGAAAGHRPRLPAVRRPAHRPLEAPGRDSAPQGPARAASRHRRRRPHRGPDRGVLARPRQGAGRGAERRRAGRLPGEPHQHGRDAGGVARRRDHAAEVDRLLPQAALGPAGGTLQPAGGDVVRSPGSR